MLFKNFYLCLQLFNIVDFFILILYLENIFSHYISVNNISVVSFGDFLGFFFWFLLYS